MESQLYLTNGITQNLIILLANFNTSLFKSLAIFCDAFPVVIQRYTRKLRNFSLCTSYKFYPFIDQNRFLYFSLARTALKWLSYLSPLHFVLTQDK